MQVLTRVLAVMMGLGLLAQGVQAEDLPAPFLDRTLFMTYGAEGAIQDEKTARYVRSEARTQRNHLDEAFKAAKDECLKAFFVEACVNKHRKAYFERSRELHSLRITADEWLREYRFKKSEEKRTATKTPPKNPVNARAVGEKKAPLNVKPREVVPASVPLSMTPKVVKAETEEEAEARLEREAQNEAEFARKQLAAQKRKANAEAAAKARRERREAQQAEIERQQAKRLDAQKRYEEKLKKKDPESGLRKFF